MQRSKAEGAQPRMKEETKERRAACQRGAGTSRLGAPVPVSRPAFARRGGERIRWNVPKQELRGREEGEGDREG